MADAGLWIFSGVLVLAGVFLIYFGFKKMHKYRIIQDTPTSKIRSMAMGLVEIHGNALADKIINTPFSQTACVYYRYIIKEYRKHVSHNRKGGTRTTYSWDTVGRGEKRIPFFVKDETGQVIIHPKGADINVPPKKAFLQRAGLFGMFGTIVNALKNWDNDDLTPMDVSSWNLEPIDPKGGFKIGFGNNVGDKKYYEYFISEGEDLYVIGTAAIDPGDPNEILIRHGENEKTFLVSDKSEKELLGSIKWGMIGSLGGGVLCILIGLGITLHNIGMF